jgi:transcriptional regulator with XRE-family HTH domain
MSGLRQLREVQGLTQVELAQLAGVSRQLLGAAESGRNLPAVDAALRIAAALGVSVEEAFGGTPAALQPVRLVDEATTGTPLRVARVGEMRIAIPLGDLTGRGFFVLADGVASEEGVRLLPGAQVDGLVVAGCDPALGIAEALLTRHGRNRLIAVYQSTGRAVRLLAEGLVHGVLVHGPDGALPAAPVPVRRWRLAAWQVGIAFAPELGHPSLEAFATGAIELAQREETAASQQALLRALRQLREEPSAAGPLVAGHLEGARRTTITRAAAVSIEPAAQAFQLGFLPLETHVVDLWIDERWHDHGGIGPLIELLRSARFRDRVSLVGSYDLSGAGTELEQAA